MKTRKEEHIKIVASRPVQFEFSTGLENIRLQHSALPEVSFDRIDTTLNFIGKKLHAPILISGMTGGSPLAKKVNMRLAAVAQKCGLAMGVGSQRVALERSETLSDFQVRKVAPDILLFANLGAVQLNYGYGVRECREVVEMIDADALVLHLNPLQEALQSEGNTDFSGLKVKIAKVCKSLQVPVIVKEVGFGVNGDVARKAKKIGCYAVDVAGSGGTSFAKIEGLRSGSDIYKSFSDWGIPTAQAIMHCAAVPGIKVIGSGGVRTGADIAKCLALGASLVGIAQPFLSAALKSEKEADQYATKLLMELRIALFSSGCNNLKELSQVKFSVQNGAYASRTQ